MTSKLNPNTMLKKLLHSAPSVSVFIFALLLSNQANAQIEPECGTIVSKENELEFLKLLPKIKESERDFQMRSSGTNSLRFVNYVPIKAHVLRQDDGSGGLTENQLNEAIAEMNVIYADAELEFFLCGGINYIDNTDYYNFNRSEESSLTGANNVNDVINIYFANRVTSATGSNLCGYAYTPPGPETIMMKNSCATNGSTLSHEVGHFFALSHTHGNSNQSTELVDGSNCSSSGDYICDTPADPRLSSSNVNWNCTYVGNDTDANDDVYQPDEQNLMSYSRKQCRNKFSVQQYARINAIYHVARNNLSCSNLNVEFETSYTNDCDNSMTVDFLDNSVGATAWEWDIDGDGNVDYTTKNPSHTYADANKYDVSLKITSDDNITIGKLVPELVNIGVRTVESTDFELTLNTDNRPSEITWFVKDNNGDILYSGGPYKEGDDDETTITENFSVNSTEGCFSFEIIDSDGDGLIGTNATGSYELRDGDGNLIVTGSDYGDGEKTVMTIGETLSTGTFTADDESEFYTFPNPVESSFRIKLANKANMPKQYIIYSMSGRVLQKGDIYSESDLNVNVDTFNSGMYVIQLINNEGSKTRSFIKK